jgi:hypothetical protein
LRFGVLRPSIVILAPDIRFVSTGTGQLQDGEFGVLFNDADLGREVAILSLRRRRMRAGVNIEMESALDFNVAAF